MVTINGNSDECFFEGVEKLMEVWFTGSAEDKDSDLRSIDRSEWEVILDEVNCKILDVIEEHGHVAYLLSESSLFVTKQRVILKTCGTTLCLQALPFIIKLAKEKCHFERIADFFYSRKNFMKPDRQPHVHQSFQKEVEYLDQILNEKSAAYCLGKLNGDCWFLYTIDHPANDSLVGVEEPDQTLEILMVDLDPEVMKLFYMRGENGTEKRVDSFSENTGIANIIPCSVISAKFFDPCGYSMNGLMKKCYWTIHVTPEPESSYVSFETNLSKEDYSELVQKILKIFNPGRFTMTLFANHSSKVDRRLWNKQGGPNVSGFKCMDKQTAQLQNYSLYYTNYEAK